MKQQINQNTSDKPTVSAVAADCSVFANLATTLTEIRKLKGVTGYILRNNSTAMVDLSPKESVTEYATLSAQISDACRGMIKQFNLADIECVLVEGKTLKVLCMNLGENQIAVFMEKTCAHAWIVKRILL